MSFVRLAPFVPFSTWAFWVALSSVVLSSLLSSALQMCSTRPSLRLEQWFSVFLMLPPLNTVPHVVGNPSHKITLFVLHACDFATVRNCNASIWYAGYLVEDPKGLLNAQLQSSTLGMMSRLSCHSTVWLACGHVVDRSYKAWMCGLSYRQKLMCSVDGWGAEDLGSWGAGELGSWVCTLCLALLSSNLEGDCFYFPAVSDHSSD